MGFSKMQLKVEREAFLYSFLLLNDFKDEKKEEEDKQNNIKRKSRKKI